jgi:hypothetical protein
MLGSTSTRIKFKLKTKATMMETITTMPRLCRTMTRCHKSSFQQEYPEQSKIPEFYGQKGKDNITAIVFIRKIDDLAQTNRWNDTTTYANMANTLKGFAHDWLFATVKTLDGTADQLTWTNLKPRFQRQFATQTDEKMIIEGLSNLAMKPYKFTGELLARITSTMVILKTATLTTRTSQPLQHTTISMGATRWTPQPGGRMRP